MADRRHMTREQRREQVERCLAADMTVKEWCELNHVSKSTMYYWMGRLRREEPELFGDPTCGEWIELSRGSITARTALAVRAGDAGGDARGCEGIPRPMPVDADAAGAVVVRLNGADVVVPDGAAEPHLSMVLRAVASL